MKRKPIANGVAAKRAKCDLAEDRDTGSRKASTEQEQPDDASTDQFGLRVNTLIDGDVIKSLEGAASSRDVTLEHVGSAKFVHRMPQPLTFPSDRIDTRCMAAVKSVAAQPQSGLQTDLLQAVGRYMDLYFPSCSHENRDQLRRLYAAHVLNHGLRTRRAIVRNNARLKAAAGGSVDAVVADQGLTRPKTLVLLPFRHCAWQLVETMTQLLFGDAAERQLVTKRRRFNDEYGPSSVDSTPSRLPRPTDFVQSFAGNTDDCFRLGVGLSKKSVKLFVDFYKADVIVASPLGLRMATGADDEAHNDFDWLSSIEVLVLDQADVFLMQNWQHALHVFEHINARPKQSHGVDFSRVREWSLNGWAKYYRQTIVLSDVDAAELRSLFSRFCRNHAGLLSASRTPAPNGALSLTTGEVTHAFRRFAAASPAEQADARFDYFTKQLLPQYSEANMRQTLVFVPSYFDFVRLRNHFKRQLLSFVQVCEYTSPKKVSRARDLFFHGKRQFLLLTERFHFYHRYRIRGICHLLFYQLPQYARFFAELCDAAAAETRRAEADALPTSVTVFCSLDAIRLAAAAGPTRAARLLSSATTTHVLLSDDAAVFHDS